MADSKIEVKTHWKKHFNPEYIGAYAFMPGEEKTLTIASFNREMVTGPDGRKEECSTLSFAEPEKPLILNVTNAKMIAKLLRSNYMEDWVGHRITLGVETVSAFGERVEAVRVKKKLPVGAADPVCAQCGQVVAASGKFTAAQIAQAGVNRFGRVVCLDCVDQLKDQESQPTADETPMQEDANDAEA